MSTFEKVERDNDYAIVISDGVKVQLGHDVSKLIFYIEELRPSEDKTKPFGEEKVKVLNFEVRLPRTVFERLCTRIESTREVIEEADKATDGLPDFIEKYNNLYDKLTSYIYDTDSNQPHQTKIQLIIDEFYDILQSAEREKKERIPPVSE